METTQRKQHPKPTTTIFPTNTATVAPTRHRRNPDPISAAAAGHKLPTQQQPASKLKLFNRVRASSKPASNPHPSPPTASPPAYVDTRLQAMALSRSAIIDSSKTLVAKPNHRLHATFVLEKPIEIQKKELREKLKKPSPGAVVKEKEKEKEKKGSHVAIDIEKQIGELCVGGRRRSFGSSKIELRDFLTCNGVKVVAVDMPPLMQIHAVDCARKTRDSLEKFTSKTLAQNLKKEFDGVYGPAWHCIVGTSFGSFVTHSVGGFMYFSMDQKLYVLLFKTTVQRAD